MRAFIVLCLVALASADVSHLSSGYNYQSGAGEGSGSAGCSSSGGGSCNGGLFDGSASNVAPTFAGADDGGHVAGGDGGFEKDFYTYQANEGDFLEPAGSNDALSSLKKNLKVVFIKGPESHGLENALANLAKAASDQRTAIYVLNKQADLGDLANAFNQANNQNHQKPEVHFVKYRTPEDAHNAQTQIQNQYAGLGGSTKSHDGGVAPVIDFSSPHGSSSNTHPAYSGGAGNGGYSHSRPSNTYVPPANTYVPPAAVPSHSYIPPSAPGNSYIPPSIFRSLRT